MCPSGYVDVKVAEERLPFVARRIALEAIDLNMLLEYYPVNTHVVERRIQSIMGYTRLLAKLSFACWRAPQPKKRVRRKVI